MHSDSEMDEPVYVNRIRHEVSCMFCLNKRVESDRNTDCGVFRFRVRLSFFTETKYQIEKVLL